MASPNGIPPITERAPSPLEIKYSNLVDDNLAKSYGAWTQFPIRVHRSLDIVRKANRRVREDWERIVGDGRTLTTHAGEHPDFGSLCALWMPECRPDRLFLISALHDWAFFHDDLVEGLQATRGGDEVLASPTHSLKPKSLHEAKIRSRQIGNQIILEIFEIDAAAGLDLVAEIEGFEIRYKPEGKEITNVEEYMPYRVMNAGYSFILTCMRFGMDLHLSRDEILSIEEDVKPFYAAIILRNDFDSYDKEQPDLETNAQLGDASNAVAILMRAKGINSAEAKLLVRDLAIREELLFADFRKRFLEKRGTFSNDMVKYVEGLALMLAGHDLWTASAPRFHSLTKPDGDQDLVRSTKNGPRTGTRKDHLGEPQDNKITKKRLLEAFEQDSPKCNKLTETGLQGVHQDPEQPKLNGEALLDAALCISLPPKASSTQRRSRVADYADSISADPMWRIILEALSYWKPISKESFRTIRGIVNMLHTSSIMLEDIRGNAELRDCTATAHVVHGIPQTINSATHLLVRAVQAATKLRSTSGLAIVLEELDRLHYGRECDLAWTQELYCPTEKEHLNMVDHKTGALFRLLLRLVDAETVTTDIQEKPLGSVADPVTFAQLLGQYFHIRGEFLHLSTLDSSDGIDSNSHFDGGNTSFVLMHMLRPDDTVNNNISEKVMCLHRQLCARSPSSLSETSRIALKKQLIQLLHEKTDCLQYAGETLLGLENQIIAEIAELENLFGSRNSSLRLLLRRLGVLVHEACKRNRKVWDHRLGKWTVPVYRFC